MLSVAPWTQLWHRNYFVDVLPWLAPLMASSGTRVVVVAAGLVTAVGGMTDLRAALSARGDAPGAGGSDDGTLSNS